MSASDRKSKRSTSKVNPREWLLEAVGFFRQLGFFQSFQNQSDEAIADELQRRHAAEWGPFDPADDHADLMLTKHDADRVWWEDTEADVCRDNDVYVKTFQEWARISRGAFTPSDIQETWEGDEGPIKVSFLHGGRRIALEPEYQDDYIDVGMIDSINELIVGAGIQFESYCIFDQTIFVVALTQDEKERLKRERNWCFQGDLDGLELDGLELSPEEKAELPGLLKKFEDSMKRFGRLMRDIRDITTRNE